MPWKEVSTMLNVRIHAVSPAAGGLPPRPLSPVRDQPHHRL